MRDLFDVLNEPPKPPPAPTGVDGIPPAVLHLFEQLADDLIERGWSHYSADAILHRVRWHFQVEKDDREFKCNNNWTSMLARWWLKRHPEHSEFFELRALHRPELS